MSRYKGLFTFDVDNHRYLPVEQADGIIGCMNYHPELEMPKEPLIKDEKIRKAVRAWAEAENCTSRMNLYYTLNRQEKYITFHNPQTGSELQLCDFDLPVFEEMREHTIAELCGEGEG